MAEPSLPASVYTYDSVFLMIVEPGYDYDSHAAFESSTIIPIVDSLQAYPAYEVDNYMDLIDFKVELISTSNVSLPPPPYPPPLYLPYANTMTFDVDTETIKPEVRDYVNLAGYVVKSFTLEMTTDVSITYVR